MDYRAYKPEVWGGVGEKDSNSGKQWKMQNRIYKSIIAVAVATSFYPYYLIEERKALKDCKWTGEG